ncbi:virulence factor Mce-like protein [Rhodococcus erythropolis]|uniref:MlaD family protein n=1 Tax=Rhodococcus erythropolis TaxID=1833 RepID=UPI0021675918|nr:MlaD family protein [Rhodococcus erythropolis]MCS4256011.1 virulence factor Mce-like protein [Rhodococcus erythropolis]MCW2425528.1 virulence factor Mce-like protein [Rhodococcus erythropolis]
MSIAGVARRRLCVLLATALVLMSTAACSLSTDDLPSVRAGVGDAYDITIEFVSVMNLPNGADVIMDGIRVGEVREVSIADAAVVVRAGIRSDTRIPATIQAIIRQNTLLGDTYVALVREPGAARNEYLAEGSTVPMSRTTSPPQLEDTMAVLATFINGGSIRRIEDVMARVNSVMPAVPDVQKIAATVSTDLHDLSGNTQAVDRMLDEINFTAVAIGDSGPELSAIFAPDAAHYWRRVATNAVAHIGTILPSIGSIYEGGLWLVPMLESLVAVGDAGEGYAAATVDISNFLRTTLIPFVNKPSIDVVSVETAHGDQIVADAENILRMLGAVK